MIFPYSRRNFFQKVKNEISLKNEKKGRNNPNPNEVVSNQGDEKFENFDPLSIYKKEFDEIRKILERSGKGNWINQRLK